ncbi:MAG: hypothetical protein EOO87_03260 [Pedobacter sp.]|nr:MAG: hypothetical protein EOO87_03260 [Pedobacter sp.]
MLHHHIASANILISDKPFSKNSVRRCMTNTEYIYIPFNKANENYLAEIEKISKEEFAVSVAHSADHKSLFIESENHNLVSIITNPVYAIVTKLEESDLAREIYEAITLQTKKICN